MLGRLPGLGYPLLQMARCDPIITAREDRVPTRQMMYSPVSGFFFIDRARRGHCGKSFAMAKRAGQRYLRSAER